ncbi:hypothetical protein [Cupriavidus sp. DL-D2]|uniref:hypothetical protein n=1 Tax=Cupriavidus sp. DL-D2 TaxID=3144974 RepID=UPI003212B268
MSIMMVFEAETGISEVDFRKALVSSGVKDFYVNGRSIRGNFPLSNMYFSFQRESIEKSKINAEGYEGNWVVGMRCIFVYVIENLDECRRQLKNFLAEISRVSAANWVLSFQYESIYATRDDQGIRHFLEF